MIELILCLLDIYDFVLFAIKVIYGWLLRDSWLIMPPTFRSEEQELVLITGILWCSDALDKAWMDSVI